MPFKMIVPNARRPKSETWKKSSLPYAHANHENGRIFLKNTIHKDCSNNAKVGIKGINLLGIRFFLFIDILN